LPALLLAPGRVVQVVDVKNCSLTKRMESRSYCFMATTFKSNQKLKLPPAHDWRTTDTDEINKRRQRAREETFVITNSDPRHPVFSNFRVKSASGLTYSVEIRGLKTHQSVCDCVDFRYEWSGLLQAR